jgi:hypothetical protein
VEVLTDSIAAGNYTLVATYMGDSVFNTNATTKDFEVIGHIMKDNPIEATVETNLNTVKLTVKVDENATGFVEIKYGDTSFNLALENGEATLTTELPYGSYSLDITYLGDENYNMNSTKTEFTIVEPAKENTTISLDIVTEENYVGMTVTVDDAATGLVKFQVSGSEGEYTLYADVIDGKAILEDTLPVDNYTVFVTYMGDDRFNTNITSGEFTIKGHIKKDTPITANADVVGNRVTLTVTVDENATGFVKLTVAGTEANIELVDGVATVTSTLPANSYYVAVNYLGDENFNANATKVAFTVVDVAKENTTISLDVDVAENNVTFKVDVNPLASGTVKFQITGPENYTLYVDVVDGKAVLDYVLKGGDYSVVAIYSGDSKFNSNVTSKDFAVKDKVASEITIDVPEPIKAGENISVSIPGATGNVSVIFEGVETIVPLVDGKANYTVPEVTAGNHSVVVVYSGDDTHDSAYKAISVSVKVLPTEFTDITISSDLNISVKLVDETGKGVANAVIEYAVGNVTGKVITGADGSFVIAGATNVTINIKYAGNASLLGTNTTLKIDDIAPPVVVQVESRFNVTPGKNTFRGYAVDTKAGEKGIAYATTLLDVNGNPIANVPIQFGVNSKIYNRTTYENGSFYPYHLDMVRAGVYTLAFSFAGNENYTSAFAIVALNLAKKPIKIKASNKSFKASAKTKKYTVKLSTIVGSSADGKAHLRSGLKVTLKLNGKTYTSKINSKGQATFNLKITKKGKFSAVISYKGSNTYEEANKNVKITIN